MSRLINPDLKNELQVLQWAVQYDSLFERLVDINTEWGNEDLRLIRIVQEFIPVFLLSRQHSIRGRLFITYRNDVQQVAELFSAMGLAYNQIVSLFRDKLSLNAPTGYIFVLVVKDRDQMGDDELGGFVIRASRFVVIPQAYYYQYGVRFLDLEQFTNNFKHELVHAFTNAVAGHKNAMALPAWFHEMTAISLGGNKKFQYRGETVVRLSKLYQEYYDAAKHLRKKHGEAKYYDYIQKSITTGDPEKCLSQIYGYASYEDLRWNSMSLPEKFSEHRRLFLAKIRRLIIGADLAMVLFASLMLLFPFFLMYMAFSENISRMKSLKAEFVFAENLDRQREEAKAILAYRSSKANLAKAAKWETYLTRSAEKERRATERMNVLQKNILAGSTRDIEKAGQENISAAEGYCYELEKKQHSLLDGDFAQKANFYLNKNFPNIIVETCKIREKSFHALYEQRRYLEAVQSCLTYALEHQTSRYYPAEWIKAQIENFVTLFLSAYDKNRSGFEIYEDAKEIKAISAGFKSHRALAAPLNLLDQLVQQLEAYGRMKIIEEIIRNQEILREEEAKLSSSALPEPGKKCTFCGELVENGLIACPNCGSGNFTSIT